jgi:hypothetical protein
MAKKEHNKAPRHHRAARLAAKRVPDTFVYEIVDPHHRPDLRGEAVSGAKAYAKGNKQYVRLTEKQASFYVTGGSLVKVS